MCRVSYTQQPVIKKVEDLYIYVINLGGEEYDMDEFIEELDEWMNLYIYRWHLWASIPWILAA